MDNISHTVVGLAAGELIHRSLSAEETPAAQQTRRRLLLTACFAASNFPDLDLFLTPLLPAPLGYLLHHRGHTHTLLYEIPQAILLFALIWILSKSARALLRTSIAARTGLAVAIGMGFVLHLLMDSLNSYGIHPFHPFNSNWFYGDMVFIVEPLFWLAFGLPLAMTVKRKLVRWFLIGFFSITPLFFGFKGFLHPVALTFLFIVGGGLAWLELKKGPRSRQAIILSFAVALIFVGVQKMASLEAKQLVREGAAIRDASSIVLDVAATSSPTNPICWGFVSVEKDEANGTYRISRGRLSLIPELVSVAACPSVISETPDGQPEVKPGLVFLTDEVGDLELLRKLAVENCHLNAWMRFARAPLVTTVEASDLRYASRGRANFSTMNLSEIDSHACSSAIPQWAMPRADMLAE